MSDDDDFEGPRLFHGLVAGLLLVILAVMFIGGIWLLGEAVLWLLGNV